MSYIYQSLTPDLIAQELLADGYASWTFEQARALGEYLEELAIDSDNPTELDPVAIRCEFSGYANALEALNDRGEDTEGMTEEQALEHLQARTITLVCDDDSVVIQDY